VTTLRKKMTWIPGMLAISRTGSGFADARASRGFPGRSSSENVKVRTAVARHTRNSAVVGGMRAPVPNQPTI
jgi:hypothetical protein